MALFESRYDSQAGRPYLAHVANFFGVSTFCRFFALWYLVGTAFLGETPQVIDILGLTAIFTGGITLDFIKDSYDHLALGLPTDGPSKQAVRARLFLDHKPLVFAVNATYWLAGLAFLFYRPTLFVVMGFFLLVGVSYKFLKRLPFAKNAIMPFMSISGALLVPAWLYDTTVDPRGVLILGGLIFAFEVHIDIPDIAHDRLENSRTLASLLGETTARRMAIGVMLLALVVCVQSAATTTSYLLLPVLLFWLFSIATRQRNHRFLPYYEVMMLCLVLAAYSLQAG